MIEAYKMMRGVDRVDIVDRSKTKVCSKMRGGYFIDAVTHSGRSLECVAKGDGGIRCESNKSI